MQKNVEMGSAGSITISLLIIAVVFLMRSFYKRFKGIDRSDESTD
jgi:ABC-type sugar transport system permease subunit